MIAYINSSYDLIRTLDRLDRLSTQLVDELFSSIHLEVMEKINELIERIDDEFTSSPSLSYRNRVFSKFMARLVANYVKYLQADSKETEVVKIMNQLMLDVSRYLNDELVT